ncbi:MAG: hypothetical protein K5851_08020, partial [Lachnospiraceae bacterium]|nr:hypothetical protein [Lachnospiraceae bacterium]
AGPDMEAPQGTPAPAPKAPAKMDISALPEDLQYVASQWKTICKKLPMPLSMYASAGEISCKEDTLELVGANEVGTRFLTVSEEPLEEIKRCIESHIGKSVKLTIARTSLADGYSGPIIDLTNIEGINMPIEEED